MKERGRESDEGRREERSMKGEGKRDRRMERGKRDR